MDTVDIHIASAAAGIRSNQKVTRGNITYHILRHTFPLTLRGFPEYFRADVVTRYSSLRRSVRKRIIEVNPDLIHVHGTEYGYGLAALDCGVPLLVSMQGIINRIREVEDSAFFRLQEP